MQRTNSNDPWSEQPPIRLGSWIWNIATNELSWSEELFPIYGVAPQDFQASYQGFLENVHPNDRNFVGKTIEEAYDTHKPFSIEHRIIRSDGVVRIVQMQGKVMSDELGRPAKMFGTTQDITERKQIEEAQQKSRAMFEGLFESAPDAIFLVNGEGRVVQLNQRVEPMFGYQREDLLGKSIEMLLPTRFQGRHVQHRAAYFANPPPRPMGVELELQGRRKDGTEFPVDITLSPLETEDGLLAISVVRDITRRKRAEEQLKYAQKFSERLITSSLDGILAFDRGCRYTLWNPSMERLSGVNQAEVLGRDAFEIFPFLKETGEDKFFYDTLAGKTAIARDRPYRIPQTGRVGFFEGYYSPIRDEAGEIVGGLAIIRDMAERKQAEKALRESETRFRAVFAGAGSGISLLDLQGQVLSGNPALQKMLGYSADALNKMNFQDFTHPADLAENKALFQKLVTGELDSYQMEKRYLCRDGRVIWGNLTVSLVRDGEGQPQFTIGMVQDITDRKQMEAELAEVQHRLIGSREAERLHLAQELHDGPLQDLHSITYQLSELWEAQLAEAQRSTLITSQVTLQRVIKFLRLICAELRPPTLAPFGLEKAIRSHAEQFQKNYPGFAVELDLMVDGQTLPQQVRFALFRIYQQALNNAQKYSGGDRLLIRFRFDQEQVTLEIQDNGRGFKMPRRRVELARQGHLGLVGAAERAEAIGGRLEIISSPEEGTVIRAIVPYSNRPPDITIHQDNSEYEL